MRRLRGVLTVIACVIASLFGGLAAPTASYAAANPNPIDWHIAGVYYDQHGRDIPLRNGQADYHAPNGETIDGFGKVHIEEGHTVVPPATDIQDTIVNPEYCQPGPDARIRCYNQETGLFVVFNPAVDPRSGDGVAFGIITAFYNPELPCVIHNGDIHPNCGTPGPPFTKTATNLTYSGPTHGTNGSPLHLSAALTDDFGSPITDKPVRFRLGTGATVQSCDATTGTNGTVGCTTGTLHQPATTVPLKVSFAGDAGFQPSTTSASVALQSATTLAYTGPTRLANGTPVQLSGVLKDYLGRPIAGRPVRFTVGSGSTTQTCTDTTDATGTAHCTISSAHQRLTQAATVPLRADFAGDVNYLPSHTSARLLLEYVTARAYGLSAQLALPLLASVNLPAQPDTGTVRTATATTTAPSCTGTVSAVVLTAQIACPAVTTTLAPETATSTTRISTATIGLPGVPVITISGLTATATSRCDRTVGTTHLTLSIGGAPVTVPTAPNSTLTLPGGTRLVINEQIPAHEDGTGITVHAVHIAIAGGLGDIILGSAISAVHNCGA